MNRHLHIVCPTVPWPADHGGAIDMLCKIEALYQQGIKIHLHYFCDNQPGTPNELNRYCESIHVYERKKGPVNFSFQLPAVVSSRINEELINNLNKDIYPILLECIRCTGILSKLDLTCRNVVVRIHNDGYQYYKSLAKSCNQIFRKLYLRRESRLLKKYQQHLPAEPSYACIDQHETDLFQKEYQLRRSFFLPAFTSNTEVNGQGGVGNFCLYHGNLSVPENEKAAIWLLTKVFNDINIPFVIAGKDPGEKLKKLASFYSSTCLIPNPSATEINDLINKAHINVLPSFSYKRPELKLIHALHHGRHSLVNGNAVEGTYVETACHNGKNANAFKSIILQLYHRPFEEEEIVLRKKIFANQNKKQQTTLLIDRLYN